MAGSPIDDTLRDLAETRWRVLRRIDEAALRMAETEVFLRDAYLALARAEAAADRLTRQTRSLVDGRESTDGHGRDTAASL